MHACAKKCATKSKHLSQKFGIAVLYVTHDQVEAMALADRVAVMSKGKVLQCAPPRLLYEMPSSREVCEFLGATNLLDGVICERRTNRDRLGQIDLPDSGRDTEPGQRRHSS